MTRPQEAVSQDKVSKAYQVRVACLQERRQRAAAIQNRFFRCYIAITPAVSRYHCLKELAALRCCAVLFHDDLSLLDDSRHFVHGTAQRKQLVNLKVDPLEQPLRT